jgi:hypothetical protein
MKELGLETEIAYLVSRIAAARTPAEKETLEQQYQTTLGSLKAIRSARAVHNAKARVSGTSGRK